MKSLSDKDIKEMMMREEWKFIKKMWFGYSTSIGSAKMSIIVVLLIFQVAASINLQ